MSVGASHGEPSERRERSDFAQVASSVGARRFCAKERMLKMWELQSNSEAMQEKSVRLMGVGASPLFIAAVYAENTLDLLDLGEDRLQFLSACYTDSDHR